VTLMNDGASIVRATLWTDLEPARVVELPPRGVRSVIVERAEDLPSRIHLAVRPGGALREDDEVVLERVTYRIAFAPEGAGGYAPAYRRAVLDGFAAVLGESAVVEVPAVDLENELPEAPDLFVGEPEANRRGVPPALEVLALGVVPPGVAGVHVDPRRLPSDPAYDALFEFRRLDTTGCDLVFPPRADGRAPERLVEDLPNGHRFAADPLAGSPAPVDHPVWPLFLDTIVERLHGRASANGWRAQGLLDPEESRVGRDVVPFDPAWVTAAPRRARARSLRDEALGIGAGLLVVLWTLGAFSRRRTVP